MLDKAQLNHWILSDYNICEYTPWVCIYASSPLMQSQSINPSPLEISHYSLLSGSIYNIQVLLLTVKISKEFYFVPTKCVFLTWLWSTGRDCLGTPAGRAPGRWWSQTTRHHLSPSETCRLWQGEYDQTQVFEGGGKKRKRKAWHPSVRVTARMNHWKQHVCEQQHLSPPLITKIAMQGKKEKQQPAISNWNKSSQTS